MEITTLILRFRDLVADTGQTIQKHIEIINSKGYVWWGWWNKNGEQVPLHEFAELSKTIRVKGSISFYLFDTGHLSLFEVKCEQIHFPTDRSESLTPDADATPDYYKVKSCKAWFKFKEIKPVTDGETVLKALAYVDIKDFFEDETINYSLFTNKIISTFVELKLQERSIWFVRKAKGSDHNHEIRLTNATHIQPCHFTTNFKSTTNNKLLWVTDLHFGSTHGFPQVQSMGSQDRSLWMAVEQSCAQHQKKDFAGVIVSGDISTRGEAAGYESAYNNFFYPLCSAWTGNDFYNWIICPGNHDFGFSSDAPKDGEPIPAPSSTATDAYTQFYNKLFNLNPNAHFCSGRRFLLGNTYPVEIIALNSVNLQQFGGAFQGHGYVGHNQLEFAEKQYNWSTIHGRNRPYRIVVMHHHILPISYTESTVAGGRYSVSLDAESLTRWMLKNHVDLVLHGHMHQPSATNISRSEEIQGADENPEQWPKLTICSLGSAGVRMEELGEIKDNMFGILSFIDGNLELEVYKAKKVVRASENDLIFKVCLPL